MPYERLIAACTAHGILSLVDGAHGYGHTPLDLSALDPDFFTSNCHKWGFVPKPCAVFYVPQRNQALIRTTFPTSHYFVPRQTSSKGTNPLPPPSGEDTPFTKMFEFVGTADNSPYFCIGASLEFRKNVCGGEEAIAAYCQDLVKRGGDAVADKIGGVVMENAEGTLMQGCSMVNIRLPLTSLQEKGLNGHDSNKSVIQLDEKGPMGVVLWGQKATLEYDTFIPFFWHANAWWARLSAQVYLGMEDFERAADVLLKVCERLTAGEHLSKE